MPIAISAYSTAYFALLFFVDYTPTELKDLAIASFLLSGLGWITVFMVEEDIHRWEQRLKGEYLPWDAGNS